MTVSAYLIVAAGGALGAVMRFAVGSLVGTTYLFPWATFGINIAGALAIGLVWGIWQDSAWFAAWGRLLVVVGILGGFTTFSAFSFETLTLFSQGRIALALTYSVLSVLVCVLLTWLGYRTGQLLI